MSKLQDLDDEFYVNEGKYGIPNRRHYAMHTHCKHGHPFDEANTLWKKGKYRSCRACQREIVRRSYYKNRGKPIP